MTKLAWTGAVAILACGLVAAATPWRIPRTAVTEALEAGLARKAGVHAVLAGPATMKLLPRPRIQASELTIVAGDGALMLDAPLLKAELDIPSLMRGAWRVTSATLVEPTATLDLDRSPTLALAADPGEPPLQVKVRSGLLQLRSASGIGDLLATGIDASASWPGEGDGIVLAGLATFRGTQAHFAGSLQHAARGPASDGATASLQIDSPLFGFSADGLLSTDRQNQFAGRVSLSTASLPRLLRTLDGIPLAIGARRAQISGDVVARLHDVALSNAQVRLDRARFEGTLAWRRDAGRGLVAGTLATDLLDLDALFGGETDRGVFEGLYRRPLAASPFATDVDLRVSASVAKSDRVAVTDAAVAVLARGDRLELTLDEAQAYGGLVKARAIATFGPEGVEAQAELSAKRLDLASLSEGLSGHERVGGIFTGRAALDGRGASLSDVVARLGGSGQIEIDGGRLSGLSLTQALRRLGRRLPLEADRRGTPTTFDKAIWDLSVRDGVLRIPDGKLTAPGVAMSFGAETDLPDGHIDVHAVAAQTDGLGALLANGQSLPFDMRGSWTGPLTLVARGHGLPAVAWPMFDGLSVER